ncbi:MAG: ABC-F type ribosomal protection protein [Firmicutes bacterium]|nr:ABC-F type ribosomal protection protein [Bacillota bacterium]
MAMINVSNLTFSYDRSPKNIFEDVSFIIDTNWKLGFIGRNGKGKTTFLNLLLGKYEYRGSINSSVNFDYFPFEVENPELSSYEIAEHSNYDYEQWKFDREISMLDMDSEILNRPFNTLSKGEQTKVLLSILFLKENNFLLIDEPTNHLDNKARESVAKYLKKKKSFILVSHDRKFLDACVDHILSINRTNIEIQQGNFSSWWENKTRQDAFEMSENEKLKKDISRLEKSAKQTADWSNKIEASKYNIKGDLLQDKGYIGHKSAKMMKRSIAAQNRKEKAIEEKSQLLKNIETLEELKMNLLANRNGRIIEVNNLSIMYDRNPIFDGVNFYLENGDRLQLKGKNGCGKSSIIKLLLGYDIDYKGTLNISGNPKISYISQDTSQLFGSLTEYARINNIDESLFKSILRKLDFEREQFDKNIENYSEGQKKKVLIAKSLCEQANLYIWDEPLNYIDVFSRMQIEDVILKYCPTMIFVEHDEEFSLKIATKTLDMNNMLKDK